MFVQIILLFIVTAFLFIKFFGQRKNYPKGPWRFPIIGNLAQLGEFPHITLTEMGKKYGSIFSLKMGSFETIVINDYKMMREILNHPSATGRVELKQMLERTNGHRRGIMMAEGKELWEQRKFSIKTLREFGLGRSSVEQLITREIEEVKKIIENAKGGPVNAVDLYAGTSLNALMVILFGMRVDPSDPVYLENIKHIYGITPPKNSMKAVTTVLPWIIKISRKWTGYEDIMKGFKCIENYIKTFVDDHKENHTEGEPRDFLDAYLDEVKKAIDPNSSFYGKAGEESLIFTIFDIFAAGGETTKNALAFITIALAVYPEWQDKIRDEMFRVAGNNRAITLSDRPNMPLMESFINEVFRYQTLTPIGFPRRSTEEFQFHGYTIPEDVTIIWNCHAAHHDVGAWGDPQNFRPERFLSPDKQSVVKPEAFLLFGYGKRTCPGEQLTRDDCFLYITHILNDFKVKPDPTNPVKPHLGMTNTLFTADPVYKNVTFERIN